MSVSSAILCVCCAITQNCAIFRVAFVLCLSETAAAAERFLWQLALARADRP